MRRGPLADSYPAAVALVVCSLIPYLTLTAAVFPLAHEISRSLAMSSSTFDVTIAVSTGAYAMGTVLAVQFASHLPGRRMLVIYEVLFLVSSVLAASATSAGVFMGAFITQGLCTSLLLIAAVPPLVTAWPAKKMPGTGGIMNLCIFGAVAVGPTIGALQLSGHGWRPLFWGVAGVSLLALAFSLLTFEDVPAADKSAPWDFVAIALAVVGCGAAFFGAGQLQGSKHADVESLVPLIGGALLIVALVVYEHQQKNPLMPVKAVSTSMPVTGIFIALMTSASSFGIMELILEVQQKQGAPVDTALLFIPELVAAFLMAGVFGLLFRTRYTPVLALSGILMVVASATLFLVSQAGTSFVAASTGVIGLGVAASVSPALFMAGFSLPSKLLQRVFAMIELMRAVTAFLVAPVLIYLSGTLAKKQSEGIRYTTWICLGIAGVGFIGGLALYLSGRPRLVAPDIEAWQGGEDQPAWDSPRLLDRIRAEESDEREVVTDAA